ncbi:hypothetical protein O181_039182 [Austropuccinia psidii MF-1]|uniref:Uncharacterized protein n=1 Tax=Austropuccinia psidii MF-1 TaxID=1389203 RepID=A0A9Q3HCM7_9BASI|nr:hypothetical protein [Austropuccinia psidii MF-1]
MKILWRKLLAVVLCLLNNRHLIGCIRLCPDCKRALPEGKVLSPCEKRVVCSTCGVHLERLCQIPIKFRHRCSNCNVDWESTRYCKSFHVGKCGRRECVDLPINPIGPLPPTLEIQGMIEGMKLIGFHDHPSSPPTKRLKPT